MLWREVFSDAGGSLKCIRSSRLTENRIDFSNVDLMNVKSESDDDSSFCCANSIASGIMV
ncbi:MAG: hypothetical protein R2847_03715 [Bacteroidia bacterium]